METSTRHHTDPRPRGLWLNGITLFSASLLVSVQIQWLATHEFHRPLTHLGFGTIAGLLIGAGLIALLKLPGDRERGRARVRRLADFLGPLALLPPFVLVDPYFPWLTIVIFILYAVYRIDELAGWRPFVGLSCHGGKTPRAYAVTLFVAALLVIATRDTGLLTSPRFWAEDGAHVFVTAYHSDWLTTLLRPGNYFFFYNNLLGLIADRTVPLEHAPLVMTIGAFAVLMLAVAIILWGNIALFDSPFKKTFAVAMMLFAPSNEEIWLNSNGSQYFLALITALILCERGLSQNTARRWIYRVVLLFAGLSGVLSSCLAPLFIARYLRERRRELLVQAGILLACLLVQGEYVLVAHGLATRTGLPTLDTVGLILGIKHVLLLWYTPAAQAFIDFVRLDQALNRGGAAMEILGFAWLLVAVGLVAWLSRRLWHSSALYLLWAAVFMTSFACLFGIAGEGKRAFIHVFLGSRYFHVPNILFAMSILTAVCAPKVRRFIPSPALTIVLGTMLVVNGARLFYEVPVSEPGWPVWKREVAAWRVNHRYLLRIWPAPWFIRLDPEVRAQSHGQR